VRCPICNYNLHKAVYMPEPGKSYLNFICPRCRRRFRYAKVRHLILGYSKLTFKFRKEEVIYDGNIAYFPKSGVVVERIADRFVLKAFGEPLILPRYKNPPFPLSELKA